jgi:PPOX class probable F420-dependent enzyme
VRRNGNVAGMTARVAVPSRPRFPDVYGISEAPEGLLDWAWADERLASARNYWVVTAGPDGRPHAAPVWALWLDEAVVFSTHPNSRKARNLAHDPRVVIHLESGDEVVILEGRAESVTLDDRIADDYESKYGYRPDPVKRSEGWYRLRPTLAYAWLESDYPNTATRFTFD